MITLKRINNGNHPAGPGGILHPVGGRPDLETFQKIDRYLRLGNATIPHGKDATYDEFISYLTPNMEEQTIKREHKHGAGAITQMDPAKIVYLKDMLAGQKGRLTPEDITYSERGNLQGAQFHAVAGRVYELAKERGLGREIPTEWFLQDIRD